MDNGVVKAADFVYRKHIPVSLEEYDKIMKDFCKADVNTMKDIDDPIYNWKCIYPRGSDEKYGRIMVSYEMKVWRNQTMGEFYGGGIVD
jgi:hypothetical protein